MEDIELEHTGCLFIPDQVSLKVRLLTSNYVLKGWKEEIQRESNWQNNMYGIKLLQMIAYMYY